MACRVFFHLKSGRFSAVGPFQSHSSAAVAEKQEVRQTAAKETAGHVSESPLHCVSTRCGHGHEPQPVPPANIRDAARGTTGVVKDAAGRIENQKAQALGPCG